MSIFGKHLKIVEQIAIVFVFAVVIPISISAFVINNVNQQAMRYQLRESAVLVANMVSDEIDFFNKTVTSNLEQIAFSLKYFSTPQAKKSYLKTVENKLPDCERLEIVNESELERIEQYNRKNKKASIQIKISDGKYLLATYKLDAVRDELFRSLKDDKRQIYVLASNGDLLAEHNFSDDAFNKTIEMLPKKLKKNEPVIFGNTKNQPLVYMSKDDPKITIIVNTTEKITKKAITNNSWKIILSSLFATFAIIFVIGFIRIICISI